MLNLEQKTIPKQISFYLNPIRNHEKSNSTFTTRHFFLKNICPKNKATFSRKVKYEAVNAKENEKNDQELKEEMTSFSGFGLRLSLKDDEETVKEENNQKKKSALQLQVGFQMPNYIKTQPPQKFFKVGWI